MRFSIRSVYARTVILLTLAILLVFSILGITYYGIVSMETTNQQRTRLLDSAEAIADLVSDNLDDLGNITDPNIASYVSFAARSTGALVWVVNDRGEIVLHTGIPSHVASDLESSGDGYYILPRTYQVTRGIGTSGISIGGTFRGLFESSSFNWLSAAWPIPSVTGIYRGEIQVHLAQQPSGLANFVLSGSLATSFLAAFFIALLFVGILSRNITQPIRLISEAAERVSKGDLSVRIKMPGASGKNGHHVDSLLTDDLGVLVNTVNSMIERLEYQERDRKDFISSVSHDLRTPITSISGFVEGMLDGTVPPERYEHYLNIVKQEAQRLQTLVNTMFEASMLSSERKINPTVFDINAVIREDVIGLEPQIAEKHLGIQTDFATDEQGRLLAIGDREAINRVVYNILINAIRFTPADGIIALTTRQAPRSKGIEVIIEDSGPGIPENEYPYIFDRFYKVDKSRTAQGSGLGLYISRNILAAHGQRIAVGRSELGGARFIFTLGKP